MKKLFIILLGSLLSGTALYYFWPDQRLPERSVVDHLIVYKSRHVMEAWSGTELLKSYSVALGKNEGDKQFEGDMRTPEGDYYINDKNPNSKFHLNLGISYPNAQDVQTSKARQRPTGGDIKIHGLNNRYPFLGRFHRWVDWTNGCIAVTNEEMDELFQHVAIGTPISIRP